MKIRLFILAATLVCSLTAKATVILNDTDYLIPDGSILGVESTINVAETGTLGSFTLTLNITGGRNGDLYAYLTHNGITSVLLNRVGRGETPGGYNDAGFAVTFSGAGADIHTYQNSAFNLDGQNRLIDTWGPDGRDVSPFAVISSDERTSNPFSVFDGQNIQGDWTLFVADVSENGEFGTLESWELNYITAVPEPTTVALGIFGGLFATTQGIRIWRKRNAAKQ